MDDSYLVYFSFLKQWVCGVVSRKFSGEVSNHLRYLVAIGSPG
jgi:hypothetical protein